MAGFPHPAQQEEQQQSKPGRIRASGMAGVPVFVMLPLDSVQMLESGSGRWALSASLVALQGAGVKGVMMDVWWGIVEKDMPGDYDWSGYAKLIELVRFCGLKIQAVMSFHQCGSNVGDSCSIPLPSWVLEEVDRNAEIVFTDKSQNRNYEYISLGCDLLPVLRGRSPVEVYADYMTSFRDTFVELIGDVIVEIQVGMGPAGELRYPSYPECNGLWRFPGIGEFQCYDKYMLEDLKTRAVSIGKDDWGVGGPAGTGAYNQLPSETEFFQKNGTWSTPYGHFFLEWYSDLLLAHGERLLSAAHKIFQSTGAHISGKVSGIHWQHRTSSHAAEVTAGYYNTETRDGYLPIASLFAKFEAILNFTCIEMKDAEQPAEAQSSPEKLIEQVAAAAGSAGIGMSGENALSRFDEVAFDQVLKQARLPSAGDKGVLEKQNRLCSFTYLRMCEDLFEPENWNIFVSFVKNMHQVEGAQNQMLPTKSTL